MSSNLAVATSAFAVVPSNTVGFTSRARALYVGTTGDLALVAADGAVVLFKAVPAGSVLPVECLRVNVTGTTASNIVGLV